MSEVAEIDIEDLRDGRNGKVTRFGVSLSESLTNIGGREGSKHHVLLSRQKLDEDGKKLTDEMSFFAKEFSSKDFVLQYIKVNDFLKKNGFLVPETTRYFFKDGKHYLLSTDMTEGGLYTLWGFSGGNTKEQTEDLKSIDLSSEDLVEIEKNVFLESKRADELGIVIYANMYHLRNEKGTKRLELCFLDCDRYVLSDNKDFSNEEQAKIFLAKLRQELKYIADSDSVPEPLLD